MIWVALSILVAVVLLAALVRLVEAGFTFFPLRGEDRTPSDFDVEYTALTATTADGERLRVWHLPHAGARARVIYFHGNGGNLSLWADVLVELWRRRFEVVAVDYRGYGVSTGSPSERGLCRDVDATLRLVDDRLTRDAIPTVYWGRSLGAALAAYAASSRPADGVILEAGFPSARSVLETAPPLWVASWLSSYRFPTARWLQSVGEAKLVMHGDADRVIPYRLGRRLFDQIPGPKRMVTIAGGDHNDLVPREEAKYWSAVDDFVRSLH